MPQWQHISLDRVELRNFKRFYGTHVLELLPEPDGNKPLILIGGDNGRGKTSIHEAIYYALYEDEDLPGITTRPNYLRAVSDRLNRRALDEGETDYSVAIELLVSGGDALRRLRIERQWEVNVPERRVIQAAVRISENGRPVDLIEDSPSAYQDFLRNVLPPPIAPFFFFDGERIQEFADEDGHETRMVEAIEDILHINVYKRLRNDLKMFVADDIERKEIKTAQTDDFFQLQHEVERIEAELEDKRDRLADIERDLEELRQKRKQADHELCRIASPHASQRDELIMEDERIEKELEDAKAELRDGFEALPILLAGPLVQQLDGTLRSEQRTITSPERLEELRRKVAQIEQLLFVDLQPPAAPDIAMSDEQVRFYADAFRGIAEDVLGLRHAEGTQRLHDIGETERQKILERLGEVAHTAGLVRSAIDRRERLENEKREIRTKLLSTSDDPHVHELIEQKQAMDEKIGRLEGEATSTGADIERLQADLATRQRQIEDRQRTRKATTEAKRAVKLAQEARRALDTFIKRLAPEKLRELRERFDEMYARLRKPEDPWHSIEIDPETWQTVLKDEMDRPLEKSVFSAGMKEMYALSLLWALARASGRELPIVIDTPAGRLDSTNRRALFEKYLPNAGHQVVVLCTDTEIDIEWARRLAPHVSKQYRLDYDQTTDSAIIRPGYFF